MGASVIDASTGAVTACAVERLVENDDDVVGWVATLTSTLAAVDGLFVRASVSGWRSGRAVGVVDIESVRLIFAPPVLITYPERGSSVVVPDSDVVVVVDSVGFVSGSTFVSGSIVAFVLIAAVAVSGDDGGVPVFAGLSVAEFSVPDSVDGPGSAEVFDAVESVSGVVANATPGLVATAIPKPTANAKPPTREICAVASITVLPETHALHHPDAEH
jgi:hypothetical protein